MCQGCKCAEKLLHFQWYQESRTSQRDWRPLRCICGILPVNFRRCMFMFHVGQEAWACATANSVANYDMSRRPIKPKIGHL